MKAAKKIYFTLTLVALLCIVFSSCSLLESPARSEKQAIKEMEKRQNKATDELVKEYDKMYKEQTNRQAKQQKKMIKKSRKKPKNMRPHERKFFLWRWLGI